MRVGSIRDEDVYLKAGRGPDVFQLLHQSHHKSHNSQYCECKQEQLLQSGEELPKVIRGLWLWVMLFPHAHQKRYQTNSVTLHRFQTSCVAATFGEKCMQILKQQYYLNVRLHLRREFWVIVVFIYGKVSVWFLTVNSSSLMAYFKINKELLLVNCRFSVVACPSVCVYVSVCVCACIAFCHPGLDCLLSGPPPPPPFLAQPCSVYITDVPGEGLEANVPEQCQHEVWAVKQIWSTGQKTSQDRMYSRTWRGNAT